MIAGPVASARISAARTGSLGRATGCSCRHELKRSSGLTQPSQGGPSYPLGVHHEARVVPIAKSLLAPRNGATGIACQVYVMSRLEEAFGAHGRVGGQLGCPVQSRADARSPFR
jgi:hypothetical protein